MRGCAKALRELERDGEFVLPVARHRGGTCQRPRRLGAPVEPAQDVPAQVGEVQGLTLVKVESLEHRLVWTSRWSASIPRAPGHWLGSIGTNQTGAKSLGVLGAQCAAPVAKDKSDKRPASQIPSHEKKSFAWVKTLRECVAIGGQMPATKIVCVMDREADFFVLFDEQRKTGKVDLLVRA